MHQDNKVNGFTHITIEKGGIHSLLTVLLAKEEYGIRGAKREALPDGRSVIIAQVTRERLEKALLELNMKPVPEEPGTELPEKA